MDVAGRNAQKYRCISTDLFIDDGEMFNDDRDEELDRAIALSLQDTSKKPTLINVDSEDEDIEETRFQEELKHVLVQASKAESSSTSTDVARLSIGNSQITNQPHSQSVVSSFCQREPNWKRNGANVKSDFDLKQDLALLECQTMVI